MRYFLWKMSECVRFMNLTIEEWMNSRARHFIVALVVGLSLSWVLWVAYQSIMGEFSYSFLLPMILNLSANCALVSNYLQKNKEIKQKLIEDVMDR